MAHFYGTLQGNRGQATRGGTKSSGIVTHTASWAGAIQVNAFVKNGEDWVIVSMVPWRGRGTKRILYYGPIGEYRPGE